VASLPDIDPVETEEWFDALRSVVENEGTERAGFIMNALLKQCQHFGIETVNSERVTPYWNTIKPTQEPSYPGNLALEQRIEGWIRWNAVAMVVNAKKQAEDVGGHLSSFASIATLYEVGFNHFFRGTSKDTVGDLIYFQGHSSEGNYARAFLEGRLTQKNLELFRQETQGQGLSSYPHPWLMPHFWQFATVSLGLGALQALYQARFIKYLENRGFVSPSDRKVWLFCGDGEMDEPEAIAGLTMAARENLDNIIYVVNCNLQRLDGLVRSNGKIIQELERLFQGAGWNVIKVIWNSQWDALFAKDTQGLLIKRLTDCVDGDLQNAYIRGGAFMREFLCQDNEDLKTLLADFSDDDLEKLQRGGHDPVKVYAAYSQAVQHKNQPTVILAQTVKGYGLGKSGAEGRNIAHNLLEIKKEYLPEFCKRFHIPLTDQAMENFDFYRPKDDSPEITYLHERRKALNGYLPSREPFSEPLAVPSLDHFESLTQGSHDRVLSTTMVLARIFNILLKDKTIGPRLVPIFSDEVRTFGMESLFRQIGIYSHVGQLYSPEDKDQLLYYREVKEGQMLEEGITEAGCISSWTAAATSYMTHHVTMVPFFTFYSMFGFQRVGDSIWAAADMRARGFLIGATAGRTTLAGEGLQHQDGQSLLFANSVPSCRAYDPTFSYEMAVIIQHGLQCMYEKEEDVFYYITAMNEKYMHPAMPPHAEAGIIKGMYLFQQGKPNQLKVQLLGSGAILREVIAAAELLQTDFNIEADIWSVTSFNELQREASAIERHNRLFPEKKQKESYVSTCLNHAEGPIIAATDYIRAYPDLIRPFITRSYTTLGTDGYGRSDTREKLRHFFEVDRYYIVIAALHALALLDRIPKSQVTAALKKYTIDPNKPNPITV